MSNLLVSLGHTGRRIVIEYTNTKKTDEQKKGLCVIFMISAATDKQKSPQVCAHNNLNYAGALSIIF